MSAPLPGPVPIVDDVDTVTSRGHEDDPTTTGLGHATVASLWESVQSWYRMGTTPAIQVCVRRNGAIVLNRAIGHAWGNAPGDRADTAGVLVTPDLPFCGFSTAKGVAGAMMFLLIEQGAFALDDRVCDYIPEFATHGKAAITIGDVLSHSAGIPFLPPAYRGIDVIADEELAVRALVDLVPSWKPGRFRVYHALTGGLILRLLVQRATGKRLREHLAEEVLEPFGFRWTNFGVAAEDIDGVVPSVRIGPAPSRLTRHLAHKAIGGEMDRTPGLAERFLTAELPSGNLVTTATELARFYEILTHGTPDGRRIIRPQTLARAVQPARWIPGVAGRVSRAGFELGARRSKFGRNTTAHFGRSGLTTQYGWADAARGLSGAILTSGKAVADADRPWRLVAQISAAVPPDRQDP